MPAREPPNRHNGGPLSDEDAQKLWAHVRAREVLNDQADDIRADIKARKELAKADGFDNNVVEAILKRRKAGEGETRAADHLVRLYEEALEDQGALPLEQTRITKAPERRSVDEVARALHGQDAPPMPEKNEGVQAAAREMDELLRKGGATGTLSVGGKVVARFGADPDTPPLFD